MTDMKPGRELDALIAPFMGWTEINWAKRHSRPGVNPWGIKPSEISLKYDGFPPWEAVPDFSTDMTAAWEIVETLRSRGFALRITVSVTRSEVSVEVVNNQIRKFEVSGVTAAHAICLAALKAFGNKTRS